MDAGATMARRFYHLDGKRSSLAPYLVACVVILGSSGFVFYEYVWMSESWESERIARRCLEDDYVAMGGPPPTPQQIDDAVARLAPTIALRLRAARARGEREAELREIFRERSKR